MKTIPRLFAVVVALTLCTMAQAQADNLLPKPQQISTGAASFTLGGDVRLTNPTNNVMLQEFLTENGFTASESATRSIVVEIVSEIADAYDYTLKGFENEAYTLDVTADNIHITAINNTGVCRAAATLMQLAQAGSIEGVSIKDWAAFKLRGFMQDVGRSFITFEELKNELKMFARFKVNCFHWHLTENQAWRFEVKAYPQLTASSSMTRFAGLYYTQEQCREIDQICHDYGIVLIPEIDMPGHSAAFERAMGHNMQTDEGVEELQNILNEVSNVFTHAPYIHIGGDEVTITRANFLEDMIAKVKSLGKYAMVWNPIRGVNVGNLDADMVQLWGTSGRKIAGKHNVDCRYNYTNHFDVFADLAGIYLSNIYYQSRGDSYIAGEISAAWNDRKTPTQEDILKQNNVWANVIASASRGWIGGGEGYIETQGAVIPNSGTQHEDFKDWERRFLHWKQAWLSGEPIPYVKQTGIRWRITDMMADATANKIDPTAEPQTAYTIDGQTYGSRIVTGGGVYLNHTWGTTVPCIYSGASFGNTVYAWTYIYSPTAQDAGALIEFQNYGRSENDGAPAAGQWDKKGSRIWLNDTELIAPNWRNAGKSINSEVDLQDENFTARAPYPIHLNEGWNKVFIKLPYASGCRLNKWMWTFVVTDTEGRNALEGLSYSPAKATDANAEELDLYIHDIEEFINSKVGDGIGDYCQETAADIRAVIDEVRATLSETKTAEERAAQKAQLKTAYEYFQAHYTEGNTNKPIPNKWYTLMSKRGSKYAQCNNANAALTGNTTLSEITTWMFNERTDGSFNIISRNGLYISPASANNTALKAVEEEPTAGWTIKRSAETGYVIIVSGTAQFNQTNSANQIYNWGSGTNTTDEGCKYVIAVAPRVPVSSIKASTEGKSYFYNMYTPNRGNRYPTSHGAGEALVGETEVSEAAAWKFVERADGTYDIINYANETYISPASNYNTTLTTVATQPSAGWTLQRSGDYWIIYSGTTAQFNQTNNNSQKFRVYNWGNQGSPNTTDTGCQYLIMEADVEVENTEVEQGSVTVNLLWNGEVKKTVNAEGYYGEKITFNNLPYFVAAEDDITLSAENDGTTINVNLTWNAPVQLSTEGDMHYYYLNLKNTCWLVDENPGSNMTNGNSSYTHGDLNAMWAFMGDPFTSIQIVNGNGRILTSPTSCADNNTGGRTFPTTKNTNEVGELSTAWQLRPSTYFTNGFFIYNIDCDAALNLRAPNVAYWNGGADGGSTFVPTEVPAVDLTDLVPLASLYNALSPCLDQTAPGCIYSEELANALAAAKTLIDANASTQAEIDNAIAAINTAKSAITAPNKFVVGKWYQFVSIQQNGNEYVLIGTASGMNAGALSSNTNNEATYYYCAREVADNTYAFINGVYGNYMASRTNDSKGVGASNIFDTRWCGMQVYYSFGNSFAGTNSFAACDIPQNGFVLYTSGRSVDYPEIAAAINITSTGGFDGWSNHDYFFAPGYSTIFRAIEVEGYCENLNNVTFRQPDEPDGNSYATLYTNYPVELPEGATAYVCDQATNGTMHLEPVEGSVVPARTAVVITGAPTLSEATLQPALMTEVPTIGTNLLTGTLTDTTVGDLLTATGNSGKTLFGLSGAFGKVGFFQTESTVEASAGRAFYIGDIDNAGSQSGVRGFTFSKDGDADVINAPKAERDTVIYDLTGRRVNKAKNGSLYIVNGKKTMY